MIVFPTLWAAVTTEGLSQANCLMFNEKADNSWWRTRKISFNMSDTTKLVASKLLTLSCHSRSWTRNLDSVGQPRKYYGQILRL